MALKLVTLTLPAYWACPLINGDYSGCTDEEEAEINAFLASRTDLGGALSCGDEEEFARNDWNSQYGSVCEFAFPILD